jgi:hypothetical protein
MGRGWVDRRSRQKKNARQIEHFLVAPTGIEIYFQISTPTDALRKRNRIGGFAISAFGYYRGNMGFRRL